MAWFNPDWDYRVKVTVQSSKVPATKAGFPVYIDLSDLHTDFWDNVKSDGGDIRVTLADGTTQQALEVEAIDTGTDTGEIWFGASSISSSVDTDFYIYYGNSVASQPAASSTYGSENVWPDYIGVWHLEGVADSTSNARDITAHNGAAPFSPGKIKGCYNFDGGNDYASHTFPYDPSNNDVTFSAWVNSDDGYGSPQNRVIDKNYHYGLFYASGKWWFDIFNGDSPNNLFSAQYLDTPGAGVWDHIVGVFDTSGPTAHFYLNGVLVASDSVPVSVPLGAIGTPVMGSGDSGSSFHLDGKVDEVRMSTVAKDADTITTEFNNQDSPSTFYAIGAQEFGFIPTIIIV